ncbi:MAG TPA: DUF3987 domain-containing protein [bacterium]|nr:DUF3987 domain-containing protein [bacterium]
MDGDVVEWQKIRAGQSFTEAVASLMGGNPYTVAQAQSPDETHSRKPDRAPESKDGAGFDSLEALLKSIDRKYGKVESVYHYGPETENHLIVVRYLPKEDPEHKKFYQTRREGGRYHYGAPPKPHPLYRRDLIPVAETIIGVEGEKCADAINALKIPGIAATTSPGGSNNARGADWSPLAGKRVICWPDNDKAGRGYIADVIECLKALPHPPTEILEIDPVALGLQEKQDAFDYLAEDRNLQEALAVAQPEQDVAVVDPEPEALPAEPAWPEPIDQAAYYGLAGDFVRTVEPHTESDPVAILIQFLVTFGNIIGRGAHFRVEADRHDLNLYAVLVGQTSRGRKGTSLGHVRELFRLIDERYTDENLKTGLSSGEGIKYAIRDPEDSNRKNADPGVLDKRLLVIEPEFVNVLRVCERQGNTLSAGIRQLWDSGNVRTLTKNDPVTVTGGHVSIIGHITADELRESLATTDQSNGFGNRFLWFAVQRSKELPEGGNLSTSVLESLADGLAKAVNYTRSIGDHSIGFDDAARKLWHGLYSHLTRDIPGLTGSMFSRAEAQARRIACLYGLLDCSGTVRKEHLRAAAAILDYVERSVRFIFGDRTGNRIADEILAMLKRSAGGLSRTDISNAFGRNVHGDRIQECLDLLARDGRIVIEKRDTGGRPSEVWKYRNGGTK